MIARKKIDLMYIVRINYDLLLLT